MKIWCDVCDKQEASVFCSADEAALCQSCDRHVHFANKLAGKHLRFCLVSPCFKDSPLCDICRERRALTFCQEDRAILCSDCDLRIHQANQHTQKHNRFLLTGVELSASPSLYPDQPDPVNTRPGSIPSEIRKMPSWVSSANDCSYGFDESYREMSESGSGSGSKGSISEYLMETTLPDWGVKDLLHHPSRDASYGSPFHSHESWEKKPFS